jgi:hypothetical protein
MTYGAKLLSRQNVISGGSQHAGQIRTKNLGGRGRRARLAPGDARQVGAMSRWEQEDFSYLDSNWGEAYKFSHDMRSYKAIAQFGKHDVLTAETPNELLGKVRRHYPGISVITKEREASS